MENMNIKNSVMIIRDKISLIADLPSYGLTLFRKALIQHLDLSMDSKFRRTLEEIEGELMFSGQIGDDALGNLAIEEIDAINDETFGGDLLPGTNYTELADYAAQTACLRLDEDWDVPGCSTEVAPDASQIPMPAFECAMESSPLSHNLLGSDAFGKLDSLWNPSSTGFFNLWGNTIAQSECKGKDRGVIKSQEYVYGTSVTSASPKAKQKVISSTLPTSTAVPPMPNAPKLEELEGLYEAHGDQVLSISEIPPIPSAAMAASDLEKQLIEESSSMYMHGKNFPPQNNVPGPFPHGMVPPCQFRGAPVLPPIPPPPCIPPIPPLLIPLVPVWLDYLTGRIKFLPPGCPHVPPILSNLYEQIKDPLMIMAMIRPQPRTVCNMPPPPCMSPFNWDRKHQFKQAMFQRKPPGMPSGRTIEDLAFDQFAGYMSCKEREWLVKIQILQCQGNATGNPYEDDYYYTCWREKRIADGWTPREIRDPDRSDSNKENRDHDRRVRRINGSRTHDINRDRESKESVPLNIKFAGSLGIPSKSSTSNPRQLISVNHAENQDEDAAKRARTQRKLRTMLIRLESAAMLLMECQDMQLRLGVPGQNRFVYLSVILINSDNFLLFLSDQPHLEISQRVQIIFRELGGEELPKVLQVSKGRSIIARWLKVAPPKELTRAILAIFEAAHSCNKKTHSDVCFCILSFFRVKVFVYFNIFQLSSDIIPTMATALGALNRDQLISLSSACNVDVIKISIMDKNTFCRDMLLTILLVCSQRKASSSQQLFLWLRSPQTDIDWNVKALQEKQISEKSTIVNNALARAGLE
uniref:CCHC-type domain-containing protein n=1 Tax=Heterorhabditis bacteriophora TaxID=37862 RepID=A0A1I7XQP5_HETBA